MINTNGDPQKIRLLIIVFILFLVSSFILGKGRFLIPFFPLASTALALYLYFNTPNAYISFTIWMWFLCPLIKRIIDYQSGYYTPGGLFTTAQFVTGISLLEFLKYLPKFYRTNGLPFFLCFITIVYASLSGFAQNQFSDFLVITTILGWLCPIVFGYYIFLHWEEYPVLKQTLIRVFCIGAIVLSIYGIFQFIFAPEWDKFWLITTSLNSRGKPEPFGIRVWSTMSAAHHVSIPLIESFIFLLCYSSNFLTYIILALTFLTLLLTRVRTAWLSLVICFVLFLPSLRIKNQLTIILGISSIFSAVILAFLSINELTEVIAQRFDSFYYLTTDKALGLRVEGYDQLLDSLVFDLVGKGFGGSIQQYVQLSDGDSSFLSMLLWFGLLGTLTYIIGISLCLYRIFSYKSVQKDNFLSATRSLSLGLLPMCFTGQIFASGSGFFYWIILSAALAGCRYYQSRLFSLNKDT